MGPAQSPYTVTNSVTCLMTVGAKTRMCFPNFHLHLREIGKKGPMCRQKKGPYVDMHFEMHITRLGGVLDAALSLVHKKTRKNMMPSMSYGRGAIVQEAISPVADLLSRDVYCTEAWTCLLVVVQIMIFNVPLPTPNMDGFESSKRASSAPCAAGTSRRGRWALLW